MAVRIENTPAHGFAGRINALFTFRRCNATEETMSKHPTTTPERQTERKSIETRPERNRMIKIAPFAALLFLLFGNFVRAQDVSIDPLSNPSQVVVMGDSLTFQVSIFSNTTSYPSGQLEVRLPAGFKLLPTNIIANTLSGDGLSGRIAANVVANTTLTLTFYVQPLCDAESATPLNNRTISYELYDNSAASTPIITQPTDQISNFYTPILNVTYPAVINDAVLNQEYTRTLTVTQTAPSSHVNNLQVTVNCPDKTAFEVTKIEVSDDNSTWTDITALALDATTQAEKYVYKITRANTFAPLSYAGQQLQVGSIVYIRETVKVTKCGGGNTNYSIAYGDGNAFCSAVSSAQVNINALSPAYGVDYVRTRYQTNINYGDAGIFGTKISNTSANPEAWMLKTFLSVYDSKYDNSPVHRFDSVALMNAAGNVVVCKIPISSNIAMRGKNFSNPAASDIVPPTHSNVHKIDFEQLPKATTQEMIDAYTEAGLEDTDGDDIYSDILPNKTVNIRIYYSFYIDNSTDNCHNNRLLECNHVSNVFWKDRCEQTWSYSRGTESGSGSTTYRAIYGGMNGPVATLDDYLLAKGEKTTFTVMMQDANASSGQGGYPYIDLQNTRIHKVEIIMPDGLDYDNSGSVKIRNQYDAAPATTLATDIIWDPASRKLIFRNTKSLAQPIYYEIPVIANATTDNTKSFRIEHTFAERDMVTAAPYRWSCWSATAPYIQQLSCNSLEMAEFTAERTSFGWEDPGNTHHRDTIGKQRANRNTSGIDLHAVGPYDNITFVNKIAVNSDIQLNSGNNVMVELTYSVPYDGALFDMPTTDVSRKIVLSYKKSGTGSFNPVTTFSSSSNLITKTNTNPNHALGVNITSFIGSGKAIAALGIGDSLKVEYHLQTTANIPTGVPALVPVQAEVYIIENGNTKQTCYPRLQTIKTFNYILNQLGSPSGDYANVNIVHDNAVFLRWQLGNATGNVTEVFPNEYRPNAFIKEMTLTIDALVKINELYWSKQSEKDVTTTKDIDYTVTYANGSTIITMLTHPLMEEAYLDYYRGWWVRGSYDIICVDPDKRSIISSSRFKRLDYPTSATTANYREQTGNTCTYGCNYLTPSKHYQTSVTTPQALKTTSTPVISWDFNINNASTFANTDSKLPNSWIAFECDAGIIPSELYDNSTGTVVASVSDGKIVSYGANKWWMKLGDLSIPTSRTYTIRCTYTACSGQPGMKIIHGFARLAYPDDPALGFVAYDSPICNPQNVRVEMTPPAVDFSGLLTHRPEDEVNGTNDFCDTVGFRAEFLNGLLSEISDLKLRVALPTGFDYNGALPAKVKFGTDTWQTIPSSNIQTSGGYLDITLSNTNQVLAAYGEDGASAYVDFRLKISCGAANNQQIYAVFSGKSGCGAQTSKTYNSSQIKIAGMAAMPIYWAEVSSPQPTPVFTNATSPTDGSFTISGKYTRGVSAGGDDLQAIIELPANLNLTDKTGDLDFSQSGTRLTATLQSTDDIGQVRTFNLTLTPANPAQWNEDSLRIDFYTGKEVQMLCDGQECSALNRSEELASIKFAMKMLEIRYSDSIVARSRFGSATTEHVEITGWLVNDELTAEFDTENLNMELWYNNGTSYEPTSVTTVSGLTVSSVLHSDSTHFTVTADIPNTENVCSMLLVLRKTDDAGTSNPYLADSAAIVVPVPQYEITTQPSPICQMAVNTPIGEDSIKRYTYSWYPSSYLGDATVTPTDFTYDYQSNPRPDGTLLTYFLSVTRPNGCVSRDTVFVQLKGIPSVKDIENVAVCHDRPFHISFTDDTNTDPLNPTTFEWTVNDVSNTGLPASGSTAYIDVEKLVNSGSAPVMASVTVTPNKGSCDGVSKTFTVKIRPQSLYNYPDLRIRACPDDGASIRLAKYIDTLDITGLEWSSPLANDGSIAADYIASSGVRTFTYTVNNPCLVSPITRKIYLETLKPNKMRPLRNNIMICYEKAEVVQINQIFGIEVGEGTWTYHALKSDNVTQQNISAYVTESHSAEYNGMVIMNGKAIYKDDNIDSYTYNGMKVKKVEFIYTPEAGSCLDGATYKIMIILTPKIN